MSEGGYAYDVSMFKDTFEHQFTYINGFLRNTRRFAGRKAGHWPVCSLLNQVQHKSNFSF